MSYGYTCQNMQDAREVCFTHGHYKLLPPVHGLSIGSHTHLHWEEHSVCVQIPNDLVHQVYICSLVGVVQHSEAQASLKSEWMCFDD